MSGDKGPGTGTEPGTGGDGGKQPDVAAMEAALKKANDEAARRRHEAQEAKEAAEAARQASEKATAELEAMRKAQMSADERAQAEQAEREKQAAEARKAEQERIAALEQTISKSEQRARQAALRAEVVAQSAALGIVDPDAALVLMGPVEFSDEGDPLEVGQKLAALLEQKPYLKAATGRVQSGGAASPPRAGDRITADTLRGMTAEQIARLPKHEVDAALMGDR